MNRLLPGAGAAAVVLVAVTVAVILYSPPPTYTTVSCGFTQYRVVVQSVYGEPMMGYNATSTITHASTYVTSTDTSGTAGQSYSASTTYTGLQTGDLADWNETSCTFVK